MSVGTSVMLQQPLPPLWGHLLGISDIGFAVPCSCASVVLCWSALVFASCCGYFPACVAPQSLQNGFSPCQLVLHLLPRLNWPSLTTVILPWPSWPRCAPVCTVQSRNRRRRRRAVRMCAGIFCVGHGSQPAGPAFSAFSKT